MTTLGVDVSIYQPATLPWREWRTAGLEVAVIRVAHGTTPDSMALTHMWNALNAGVTGLGAYHFLQIGNGAGQAAAFLSALQPWYKFAALDIEQAGVTATDVTGFCVWYSAHETRPLVLYGNNLLAQIVVAQPALSKYGVWWANYPAGTARISAPPAGTHPSAPASLNVVSWQFTGTGLLEPYAGNIDLSEWFEVPGEQPMPVPIVAAGPDFGIHSIVPGNTVALAQRAVDAGWYWPVVKVGNDAAACDQVLQVSPLTRTICRYIDWNMNWQGMQNVGSWSQATREQCAQAIIQHIQDNATADQQKRHVYEMVNEPNPREEANGYTGLGLALIELIKAADQTGIHLALPAFPQGVPEWSVIPGFSPGGGMVELVQTGLFGYMKAGGHIYTCHEGVFDADAIDKGFGDLIPGAPVVAGAGSECFRYRYLYSLLKARNEVVPLVISECYYGGGYPPAQSNADIMARAAWCDRECRKDDYVIGVTPFTVNSDGHWRSYDDFYASAELWNYIAAEKDIPNGTNKETTMPITQATIDAMKAKRAGIDTLTGELDTIIAGLVADNWWNALPSGVLSPSRQTTNMLTTLDFYHLPTDTTPYTTRTYAAPGSATIDVYERQGDSLRVTNGMAVIWVKASQVRAFS